MPQPTNLHLTGAWLPYHIWEEWHRASIREGFISDSTDFPCDGNGQETLEDQVAKVIDLCRKIERIDGELPNLFGHSAGGYIAQIVASRLNIPRLVLVCSAGPVVNFSRHMATRIGPYLRHIMKDLPFQPTDEHARHLIFNRCPDQFQSSDMMPLAGRTARDILTSSVEVPSINCPCLIIGGRHDRMMPLFVQRQLRWKYRRNCEFWIEDCGHMPMLEGRLEDKDGRPLIDRILRWLRHQY